MVEDSRVEGRRRVRPPGALDIEAIPTVHCPGARKSHGMGRAAGRTLRFAQARFR